ncbi:MAG: YiiX/YebB-like N1pC/P60 family cysteine hydrolase [Spirochaetota bacterium]
MKSRWIRIRDVLFYLCTPVIKLVGKISVPYIDKDPMHNFYTITSLLRPMDIILTTSYGHMSNFFNPGKYKHAIAYVGETHGVPMIVEAIGKGVIRRSLVECLSSKDEIAVLRPKEPVLNDAQKAGAIQWIEQQVGKPYDYQFDMNSQRRYQSFFCSELIYFAIKQVNPETSFVLMDNLGVPTVSPGDFYRAEKKFDLIYETKPGKSRT